MFGHFLKDSLSSTVGQEEDVDTDQIRQRERAQSLESMLPLEPGQLPLKKGAGFRPLRIKPGFQIPEQFRLLKAVSEKANEDAKLMELLRDRELDRQLKAEKTAKIKALRAQKTGKCKTKPNTESIKKRPK